MSWVRPPHWPIIAHFPIISIFLTSSARVSLVYSAGNVEGCVALQKTTFHLENHRPVSSVG